MAAASVAGSIGQAGAITGNYVTDNEHPYVGLAVFETADGFSHRCSGSLLTPTVFLTAGHCTDDALGLVKARVYFQQDAGAQYDPDTEQDPHTGYPDTCDPDPDHCREATLMYDFGYEDGAPLPNIHDVGIVILDEPYNAGEFGVLASAGWLDDLATARGKKETQFSYSGYGLSYSGPKKTISFRSRLMATSKLTNLRSHLTDGYNLQTNGNGSTNGGTCGGDSGGPVFYGGTSSNLIVAVTSFGLNEWCRGTDFEYRVDRQAVIDWILDKAGSEASEIQFATP